MSRSTNEIYANMGTIADYGAASAFSEKFVVTENVIVKSVIIHHEDAASGADATVWELYVDGSDSGFSFTGNKDAAADTGELFGISGRFEAVPGQLLELRSDGADAGTPLVAYATLILTK